jgi:hypothetical protein
MDAGVFCFLGGSCKKESIYGVFESKSLNTESI